MTNSRLVIMLISLLVVSCSSQDTTKIVRAEKVVSLSIDTTFSVSFPELSDIFQIRLINDTLLVFQEQTNEDAIYHFKVYSTNTFNYLGSIIRNGRGPGEMIQPHMAISDSKEKYLNINLNAIEKAFSIDVNNSLEEQSPQIVHTYSLPSSTIDWIPVSDSTQFVFRLDGNSIIPQVVDTGRNIVMDFPFALDSVLEHQITYLSSFLICNKDSGLVAQVMQFLPQINFFDTVSGQQFSLHTIPYKKSWESVTSHMLDINTKQYYIGATCSREFVFASYKGISLGELIESAHGTRIHILDWSGHFLCDICVEEDIRNMAFDSQRNHLYCIDNEKFTIVRYDLNEIVSKFPKMNR